MSEQINEMEDLWDIPGKAVAEAEAGSTFKLNVPPDASVDRNNPLSRRWTEVATILSCTRGQAISNTTGNTHATFIIEVEFGPEGSGLNVGRKMKETLRLSKAASSDEGKSSFPKEATMNRITTKLLAQFFAALGIEARMEDGGLSREVMTQVFNVDGQNPCAGEKVGVEVNESPRKDKGEIKYGPDGKPVMNYGFSRFVQYV